MCFSFSNCGNHISHHIRYMQKHIKVHINFKSEEKGGNTLPSSSMSRRPSGTTSRRPSGTTLRRPTATPSSSFCLTGPAGVRPPSSSVDCRPAPGYCTHTCCSSLMAKHSILDPIMLTYSNMKETGLPVILCSHVQRTEEPGLGRHSQ